MLQFAKYIKLQYVLNNLKLGEMNRSICKTFIWPKHKSVVRGVFYINWLLLYLNKK